MENYLKRVYTFLTNYFSFAGQLVPQQDAEQSIRDGVSFSGTNMLVLILAILIASLGLNTNSTAVIIGAMLISPLMGPIIGVGLGVGIHDFALIKRSARNLVMAALFSVLASTIYFLISPVSQSHSELLARTSPTIYDVLIGFFGGGAGIIALGSRNKGNVIPGVAIATALMPPLCTAGYGLATWQLSYFFGAFYLFIINSIYIAFATFIGVKLLGYKGVTQETPRSRRVTRVVYTLAILTMLPSIWLTYTMLRQSKYNLNVENFIAQQCNFPATQVLAHSSAVIDGRKQLTITLIGRVLPTDSLELALTPRLAQYGLEGTHIHFIQGDAAASVDDSQNSLRDIYSIAQNTITAQQHEIDSLKQRMSMANRIQDAGAQIAPELRVLFPEVEGIAISRDVYTSVATHRCDTINIAMVHFRRTMPAQRLDKFRQYLEARLSLPSIHILPTSSPFATSKAKDKQ